MQSDSNLVAVATIDQNELLEGKFLELLRSGNGQVAHWYLSLRGKIDRVLLNAMLHNEGISPSNFTLVEVDECGVSKARNAALIAIFARETDLQNTFVMFPDDDAIFSSNALDKIESAIESKPEIEIWIAPYAPTENSVDRNRWPYGQVDLGFDNALRLVSSAGLLIRLNVLTHLACFDERLGVGTALQAGEDTEIVLRAIVSGFSIGYLDHPILLHPYYAPKAVRSIGSVALVSLYQRHLGWTKLAKTTLRVSLTLLIKERSISLATKSVLAAMTLLNRSISTNANDVKINLLHIPVIDPQIQIARILMKLLGRPTKPARVYAAHITALNQSQDPTFSENFNEAEFRFVDGISIAIAVRIMGGKRVQKLATTDYAPEIMSRYQQQLGRRLRIAVIGGENGIAEVAASNLEKAYGYLPVFTHDGFSQPAAISIEKSMVHQPDVLIVGLGMPLEAIVLAATTEINKAPLTLTCGGWLRILANLEIRSPIVWQKLQLEWLWRLITDPKRTAARYLRGVFALARLILNKQKSDA